MRLIFGSIGWQTQTLRDVRARPVSFILGKLGPAVMLQRAKRRIGRVFSTLPPGPSPAQAPVFTPSPPCGCCRSSPVKIFPYQLPVVTGKSFRTVIISVPVPGYLRDGPEEKVEVHRVFQLLWKCT